MRKRTWPRRRGSSNDSSGERPGLSRPSITSRARPGYTRPLAFRVNPDPLSRRHFGRKIPTRRCGRFRLYDRVPRPPTRGDSPMASEAELKAAGDKYVPKDYDPTLYKIRHSFAHVLAQAVTERFPD